MTGQGRAMFGVSNVFAGDSMASGAKVEPVFPFLLNGLAGESLTPLCGRENIKLHF